MRMKGSATSCVCRQRSGCGGGGCGCSQRGGGRNGGGRNAQRRQQTSSNVEKGSRKGTSGLVTFILSAARTYCSVLVSMSTRSAEYIESNSCLCVLEACLCNVFIRTAGLMHVEYVVFGLRLFNRSVFVFRVGLPSE